MGEPLFGRRDVTSFASELNRTRKERSPIERNREYQLLIQENEEEFQRRLSRVSAEAAARYDQNSIQAAWANDLRQLAIQHLYSGKEPVAKYFRGEYAHTVEQDTRKTTPKTFETFLQQQSQNGSWGTYIELAALGELFDCDVVVTTIKNGVEQDPWCIHCASTSDNPKPLIHLYNTNNTHWFFSNEVSTKGDGNCLYNAFAQARHAALVPTVASHAEASAQQSLSQAQENTVQQPLSQEQENIAQKRQQAIRNAIQKASSQENANKEWEKHVKKLSDAQRTQLDNDYQWALKMSLDLLEVAYDGTLSELPRLR